MVVLLLQVVMRLLLLLVVRRKGIGSTIIGALIGASIARLLLLLLHPTATGLLPL